MARFNTRGIRDKGTSPVTTAGVAATSFEGGDGYERDAKSELYVAALSTLNEPTFYEDADTRNERLDGLVGKVADDDEWLRGLIHWLRTDAGMRSAPTMIAIAAVHARLSRGIHGGNRSLVRAAIERLDEAPGALAAWIDLYGKPVPNAVKRAVADALVDLLHERSYLKWRGTIANGSISLRDAILMTHPRARTAAQNKLFKVVLDRAYDSTTDISGLPVLEARARFDALPIDDKRLAALDATKVGNAGLTHEIISGLFPRGWAASTALSHDDADWGPFSHGISWPAWRDGCRERPESLGVGGIPWPAWRALLNAGMGAVAVRMNLRRMLSTGVSDRADLGAIIHGLKGGASSYRPMPIETWSALRAFDEPSGLDCGGAEHSGARHIIRRALSEQLSDSLANVPALPGRTLILVDSSGSMGAPRSAHSTMTWYDVAALFGVSLALRAEHARLVRFDTETHDVDLAGVASLDDAMKRMSRPYGGTDIESALRAYDGEDRVILITDEQSAYKVDDVIPRNIPVFTWNLGGYRIAAMESKPYRTVIGGGLTDLGFQLIPAIENGYHANWPWLDGAPVSTEATGPDPVRAAAATEHAPAPAPVIDSPVDHDGGDGTTSDSTAANTNDGADTGLTAWEKEMLRESRVPTYERLL